MWLTVHWGTELWGFNLFLLQKILVLTLVLLRHSQERKNVNLSTMQHIWRALANGYGYSRKEFLTLATGFAVCLNKKKAGDPAFTQSWFYSFKTRNPELSLCTPQKLSVTPQKLSVVRSICTSEGVLDKYFSFFEVFINTNDSSDKPEKIWNSDETVI